ncbi:pyridoxal-5'-phosphate-dependent protein [Kiloniella litopenaei]|uniref:Pyridoxal-5'-phosphate-dependent protein n=1 Tax=Kiloniella litopenaei TaxID=1549748 RepID=A0A0M2R4K4_9PROT|nr:threonine/serine dehydratase [Kiloniella litopenaei]KKJ76777.1 pyridoxal-5'-phosphate-dependent protein [Kiloniella litopenaei]
MSSLTLPTYQDLLDAQQQLNGKSIYTPLLENATLNHLTGGRVFLKAEVLQHTGSFKLRGAYNFISTLTEKQKKRGLLTYSSGNHAQGVAYASKLLGAKATIIMPSDAPQIKIDNTRAYGAEVILYDRYNEDRETIGANIMHSSGALLIPPYDHPLIIAGQGTCGLEILEQLSPQGVHLDAVVSCFGGGGLTSGIALAFEQKSASTKIYSAEPQGFDDMARSLVSGKRLSNEVSARSICDAVLTPTPGQVTFSICNDLLEQGLVVTDDEVKAAVKFAFNTLKVVVEPGGAVALAAILHKKIETKKKAIALTLSGGNVDPSIFKMCLES